MTTVLLLAGGASRRMGRDKRLLPLGGRTLVGRAYEAARHIGPVWVLVSRAEDEALVARHLPGPATFVADPEPGAGPMAALAAALPRVPAPRALLLAADLALVSAPFLTRLTARAEAAGRVVVVPRAEGHLQVTCAVYPRALAPALGMAVERGESSLSRFVGGLVGGAPPPGAGGPSPGPRGASPRGRAGVRPPPSGGVHIVEPAVWTRWPGAGGNTFAAVNTPAEYQRLKDTLG